VLNWMVLLLSSVVPTLVVPPIAGLSAKDLHDTFNQRRGLAKHEAIDIMEPRGTPVHAVVDGTIAKLFLSKPRGNTIYLFDRDGTFCYYYAHLDHYASQLHEGMSVSHGQVIAYVGSTAVWNDWEAGVFIIQPATVIGWQRTGFGLFWRWKIRHGKPGRPAVRKTCAN